MTKEQILSMSQAVVGHYPPALPAPCPSACRRCARVSELVRLGEAFLVAIGADLKSTSANMRKDGQGLSLDQEATIRRGMSLP